MRSILVLSMLLFPLVLMGKDEIPLSVKNAINKQFPDWKIRPNYFPNPCDSSRTDTTSFEPQGECDLNGDDIPDYVLAITTGNDSNLVEYFIAVISNDQDYKVFTLTSAAAFHGAGERHFNVIEAGNGTALFLSDGDTVVYRYAKSVPDSTDVVFPTDIILIYPMCEDIWKEVEVIGFVFINNRFYSFGAAD